MIEENAKVVALEGEQYAWVETTRKSACGSCSVSSTCGTSLLANIFGQKKGRVKVLNSCHAKPGDNVIIAMDENDMLKGSLALYFVPLLSLIGLSLVASLLAKGLQLSNGLSDLLAIIAAAVGLYGGFKVTPYLVSKKNSKTQQKQDLYQAKILRIIQTPLNFYQPKKQ